nr:hypothetical protein [Escherichia coli]
MTGTCPLVGKTQRNQHQPVTVGLHLLTAGEESKVGCDRLNAHRRNTLTDESKIILQIVKCQMFRYHHLHVVSISQVSVWLYPILMSDRSVKSAVNKAVKLIY